MLGAALLFATMGALVKLLAAARLPNEMIVFFRSAIGLLALLPLVWRQGPAGLRTTRLRGHLGRSLAGLAAMYCFFYAIGHMHLATAVLLNYSTPLFIPIIAVLWLKEPMARRLWWPILIGFGGILLILKPGVDVWNPVALAGLSSGLLAAVAMVSVRRLTRTEPATRVVFYFTVISTLVSALPLIWAWTTPAPELWGALIAMGVLASVAQLLMTRAYAHAPAPEVGPFTYSTVVFAAILAWLLWNELPDRLSLIGAGLVALTGILTLRRAGRHLAVSVGVARTD